MKPLGTFFNGISFCILVTFIILLSVSLCLADRSTRGVASFSRGGSIPYHSRHDDFNDKALESILDKKSTVMSYLKRHPNSLNMTEWERMISIEEFNARRKDYHTRTSGIADIKTAQSLGYCPQPSLSSSTKEQNTTTHTRPTHPTHLSLLNIKADKELGYNLEGMLPYAYYLHIHGCLNETHSYEAADPFFFFDTNYHSFKSVQKEDDEDDDGSKIHIYEFETWDARNPFMKLWYKKSVEERKTFWNPLRTDMYPSTGLEWPSFKAFYSNQIFIPKSQSHSSTNKTLTTNTGSRDFSPIAIVAGKHNKQWGSSTAVNSFAKPDDLLQIIEPLITNGYTVIYNRVRKKLAGDADYNTASDPGDYKMLSEKFIDNDLITFEDLWQATCKIFDIKEDDMMIMNLLQLAIYSQASLFIDTQGGASVISSLFPGEHLILHRQGHEKIHNDTNRLGAWAYHNWWRHAGGRFYVFDNVAALASKLKLLIVEQTPPPLPRPPNRVATAST